MAATAIGNALTTKVEQKNSPRKRVTADGTFWEYRFTQKKGTSVSEKIGDQYPAASGYYISEIGFEPQPGGGYETLVIVTGPEKSINTSVTPPVGTIWFEADANPIEIPIEQHPNYSSSESQKYEDGRYIPLINGNAKKGVESYLVPQPTFTRYEILNSFTFSETNIISAVGTRNAPTGMTSPTGNKWLKMRLSVRQTGNIYEKSETWQYASAGWDQDIYS
jgi:hypothetical protein